MQLIKVSVVLEKIEKPLDPPWRRRVVRGSLAMSAIAWLATFFVGPVLLLGVAAASVVALIFSQRSWVFLPPAARRFRAKTHEEHGDLVRRTEAFNRAWCLAERMGKTGTAAEPFDPFVPRFRKLEAEVEAYAARYRAAAASDLERVGADSGRAAVRQAIVDRSRDLVELEAKLDELGADADPEMRKRARTLRDQIETDIRAANLPLGILRRRRPPSSPPVPLPTAKVVSHRPSP